MEMMRNISRKILLEEQLLKDQFKNIKINNRKINFLQMTLKMKKTTDQFKRISKKTNQDKMNNKME